MVIGENSGADSEDVGVGLEVLRGSGTEEGGYYGERKGVEYGEGGDNQRGAVSRSGFEVLRRDEGGGARKEDKEHQTNLIC